jgi:hypothetical protein
MGAGDASSSGDFAALTPFLWKQLRQLQGVVTNEQVAGVAQLDGMSHPTLRWVLDPLSRFRPQQLGETNTGDPQGLVEFCAWANANCPAEVEVLILSGHGLAFQDARTSRYLGRGVFFAAAANSENKADFWGTGRSFTVAQFSWMRQTLCPYQN